MPATPSLSQLRAHLSALLPSKHHDDRPDPSDEVVVAHDDAVTLATTLEILTVPTGGADAQPKIQPATSTRASALPRR